MRLRIACFTAAACLLIPCSINASNLDAAAESYVKLVLAVGVWDSNYVDFYVGPDNWREQANTNSRKLADLGRDAQALQDQLKTIAIRELPKDESMRLTHLQGQLSAVKARIDMLLGSKLGFDAEAMSLYDATVPRYDVEGFEHARSEIDKLLPGDGRLADRVDAFRANFVIAPEKLPAVFGAAIKECRRRTLMHMSLPANERFTVEYVTDKPWSGYNWYQGDNLSRVQINTDLPVYIERAVDLGCHEGYPGHHVYYTLLDTELVQKRGWLEFSVYALNSPQSLIAEGSANFGKEMAFRGNERLAYERDVLYPLAGLDPRLADKYSRLLGLLRQLRDSDIAIARGYLNGELGHAQAVDQIVRYRLYTADRAAQRVRFFDTYRSYVINYTLGEDLVSSWVERHAEPGDEGRRWTVFVDLLTVPRLPSSLAE